MAGKQQDLSVLLPGQQLGGCRIVRLIGRGGMGEVYLAEHLALERRVALKTLRPETSGTEREARFLREARTCARIEHPNVVTIHDVGEAGGIFYIIMQYVKGKDLAELLKEQGGPLPWRSALRLIRLAAKGLHAVHRQGLIHRDVKPSNIMLAADARVLLMDFGLVRDESDSELTQMSQLVGTPAFMSPEQCRNKKLDCRSDIFSLGATLYCLLTARPPFQGTTMEVLGQIATGKRARPVHELNPHVPKEVSSLVAKAMSANCRDRFSSAAAMAQEITELLKANILAATDSFETSGISAPAVETQPIPELLPLDLVPLETTWDRLQGRLSWVIAGAAVAGLLLIALAVNLYVGNKDKDKAPLQEADQRSAGIHADAAKKWPGMVLIEAGYVRIGNDEAKLRRHFRSFAEFAQNPNRLDNIVQACRAETERRVHVPAFWIDQYEVTNAQYARFLQATAHAIPAEWTSSASPVGKEDCPIDNITYADAEGYARWAGKKLPTREQWLRAYRGDTDVLYPWGDDYDISRANTGDNKSFPSTSPVTATPRDVSAFQVYNLVGNVAEFIRDEPVRLSTAMHVAKGGHFGNTGYDTGSNGWSWNLAEADFKTKGIGFRCVAEEPKPDSAGK